MTLQDWKKRIQEEIAKQEYLAGTHALNAWLAGVTLWPVIEAAQVPPNYDAISTFTNLMNELGLSTLNTRVWQWVKDDLKKEQLAGIIDADLKTQPALQQDLDLLFEKLGVLEEVLKRPEEEQLELIKKLYDSWNARGVQT